MPSGGGNGASGGRAHTTLVYPIGDLTTHVMAIAGGAYPRTLAFDTAAKQLYAQNHDTQLIAIAARGEG